MLKLELQCQKTNSNFWVKCDSKVQLFLALGSQRLNHQCHHSHTSVQTLILKNSLLQSCQYISVVHHLTGEQSKASSGRFSLNSLSLEVRNCSFYPQCPDETSLCSSACPRWKPSTTLYRGGCSQLNVQSGGSEPSWLYSGGATLITTSIPSTLTTSSDVVSEETRLPSDSSYDGG